MSDKKRKRPRKSASIGVPTAKAEVKIGPQKKK